jgi:hypothetical protein
VLGYFPTSGARWWDDANGPIPAKSEPSPFVLDLTTQQAGWTFQILPYIEQDNLWRQSPMAPTPPGNNGTANNAVIERAVIETYTCPTRGVILYPSLSNGGRMWFRAACISTYGNAPEVPGPPRIHSPGGLGTWNFEARVKMTGVSDGTSNTIMIGERYMAQIRYAPTTGAANRSPAGSAGGSPAGAGGCPNPTR